MKQISLGRPSAVTCGVISLALFLSGPLAERAATAGELSSSPDSVRGRGIVLRARKHTPAERMAPARLKAAHQDAERIRKARRVLPPLPGLNDYRAILHAHAEDSRIRAAKRGNACRSEESRCQRHPPDRPPPAAP